MKIITINAKTARNKGFYRLLQDVQKWLESGKLKARVATGLGVRKYVIMETGEPIGFSKEFGFEVNGQILVSELGVLANAILSEMTTKTIVVEIKGGYRCYVRFGRFELSNFNVGTGDILRQMERAGYPIFLDTKYHDGVADKRCSRKTMEFVINR